MRTPESTHTPITRPSHRGLFLAFASSKAAVASLFFLLALLVRLYFVRSHPNFDNIFSVRGVPYSDGHLWVSAAIELAQGHGLGAVLRPGFSILLAFFYVWFGTSFQIITELHVLIGALTAALIYLVGERVFTKEIASAAALFFVFDPSQLVQTPQATTEPLGLMFFVGSIYCLLRVEGREKLKPAVLGGTLLALSNLTRPLTLFCAPFYAGHLVLAEWLRKRNLKTAVIPACAFCIGLVLTMAPWLVRQRLSYGVWAVSTNLAEALYGATSPKYKTWKYTVRADADREGVEPTVGARYKYFIAESLKNIQRYPGFYAGQVSRSFWEFLNSFSLTARSNKDAFEYGQWSRLVEAQLLFFLVLTVLLLVGAMRAWLSSGPLAGGLFGLISIVLLALWHFAPLYSGVIILATGVVTSRLFCRWSGIALLGESLAVSGLGNAVFNNAIFYRAVLMTDWIFTLFYLGAFYFSAILITESVLRLLRKGPAISQPGAAARPPEQLVLSFERAMRMVLTGVTFVLAVFILAGSIRLLILNFSEAQHSEVPGLQLLVDDKREIIAQLRKRVPTLRKILPDPEAANLTFVASAAQATSREKSRRTATAPSRADFSRRMEVAIWCEPLSPFVYYFPSGSGFEQRGRLFRERPFNCSVFPTSGGVAIFPGRIPRSLREHRVVLVGWIEGVHPDNARFGQVMQCIAIIPVLDESSGLDYEHAAIVKPRRNGVL